jgi:ribosomal protein S13
MLQQGHVLKLKTRGGDGKPTWAYRYRVDGRGPARPQVGGFASQGEALQALQRALERLRRRNGRLGHMTLSELVEEYLAQHEAEPRTLAKLRWLLVKATGAFGDRRVVELRSDEIGAWRTTLPVGHRFEATQALRQVLNRAVAWKIIDSIRPSGASTTRGGNTQRSARSSRGQRSTRSPSTSALSTGRWSSSPPPPAYGRANGSRSNDATSTARRGSSTCAGPSRTGA